MRSVWGILAASLALAGLMQVTNCLFEAAGSVPDLEGCGYLAGGLLAHAVFFPALAALIGFLWTRRISLRSQDLDSAADCGRIGALGATLYLSAGMALAVIRGQNEAIPPAVALWSLAYVTLCFGGGRLGAALARNYARSLAWRDAGG